MVNWRPIVIIIAVAALLFENALIADRELKAVVRIVGATVFLLWIVLTWPRKRKRAATEGKHL